MKMMMILAILYPILNVKKVHWVALQINLYGSWNNPRKQNKKEKVIVKDQIHLLHLNSYDNRKKNRKILSLFVYTSLFFIYSKQKRNK